MAYSYFKYTGPVLELSYEDIEALSDKYNPDVYVTNYFLGMTTNDTAVDTVLQSNAISTNESFSFSGPNPSINDYIKCHHERLNEILIDKNKLLAHYEELQGTYSILHGTTLQTAKLILKPISNNNDKDESNDNVYKPVFAIKN